MADGIETWTARITAALLRRGRMLQIASLVSLVLSAAEMARWPWLFVGAGATALAGAWFGFRVAVDADLFASLATDTDLATFDAAMRDLGLMAPEKRVGTLAERARRAITLLKWQGACFIVQVGMMLAGLIAPFGR